MPPRERTLSPVRSAFASSPEVEEEPSAFQWLLFLDFFSIKPMPSRTLVMSYIRRFCTCRDSAARFRSIVPSSACSIRVTNFFVSKLSELNAGYRGGRKKGNVRSAAGVFPREFLLNRGSGEQRVRTCRIDTSSQQESAYRPQEPVFNATPAAFGAVAHAGVAARHRY